ncbi:MAG: AAA domain-containing protein [Actinobacteria bacterium]|nr:AAA domain-containing protein [Actinomycetota bacterium]
MAIFEAAYASRLPVLLKGPTGSGKTRFLEHMAWRLSPGVGDGAGLRTIACHEDLTVGDLVGRHLLTADETVWVDGPLTSAVRDGGICYLDEIVEARKDTTVVIHSLTDHRRFLPIEKLNQVIEAHPDFQLVISYNPGYQSALKELKPSTRQRFVAIDFDYPEEDIEIEILKGEADTKEEVAAPLVKLANHIRNLDEVTHLEGPGTRLLVYTAQLIQGGVDPTLACTVAITSVLTDEPDTAKTLDELVSAVFGA